MPQPMIRGKKRVHMPGIDDNLNNSKSVQDFIKSQIYMMGFSFGVNAGSNPNNAVVLSGVARRLFGVVLYVSHANLADDDTFSLVINQELVISTVYWKAFYPSIDGNFKTQMFFPIPRPLSGSDSVNFSWTAQNAKTVFPIFYLSDSAS